MQTSNFRYSSIYSPEAENIGRITPSSHNIRDNLTGAINDRTAGLKQVMILRRKQVEQRTGLSRSTIYLRISQGDFPKAVSLGARAVGWFGSEIEDWLHSRVELSRG